MSLDDIKKLARKWRRDEVAKLINTALDEIGFSDEYVRQARDAKYSGHFSQGWAIKDAIWGMVQIDAETAALIDSPLLQRLRWIHQLGFSYLVYPSAEHSRFPHSVGVYHVVTRFLDSIDKQEQDSRDCRGVKLSAGLTLQPPSKNERSDLIHAAILHDIGHLPFSHASERVLEAEALRFRAGERSVDDFKFDAEDALEKSLSLSECLSVAIVLSDRFRRFYTQSVRPGDPEAPERIAALIAGIRTDDANRALPDLISSGLDADKIDYLARDADSCKISLGLDVARVFLRSMFVRVPAEQIPKRLRSSLDPPNSPLTVFVVNSSGIDTIDEITFARAAMYQRVYQHQVTRGAERLLGRALVSAAEKDKDLVDLFYLWSLNDALLLAHLRRCEGEPALIADRLINRRLLKKAGVFGGKLVDPVRLPSSVFKDHIIDSFFKQFTGTIIDQLKEDQLSGVKLSLLEGEILNEATKIIKLSRPFDPNCPNLEPTLVAVLPIPNLGHTRGSECFVLERDGHLSSSRDYSTAQELSDAAQINKGLGYVFADDPWREYVFLAVRSALYNFRNDSTPVRAELEASTEITSVLCFSRFKLDLERSCRRSKVDFHRVSEIMDILETHTDYYDSKAAIARPWVASDIYFAKVSKLAGFNGQHGWTVSQRSIGEFVSQFAPRFRHEVAQLLERIQIIDRASMSRLLRDALDAATKTQQGRVFLVALSPNSGQQVRMLFEQEETKYLKTRGWKLCKSIQEALEQVSESDHLIFIDDNIYSGSQAESQFRAWLGIPRIQWPLELRTEAGIEDCRLSDTNLALLGKVSISIAVCAGNRDISKSFKKRCTGIGIRGFNAVYAGMELKPESTAMSPELKNELSSIGTAVLTHCRGESGTSAKPPSKRLLSGCKRDSLGYEEGMGLLATLFSVPTSTITALWCPGVYKGEAWVPLFLRRGYFDKLVVS